MWGGGKCGRNDLFQISRFRVSKKKKKMIATTVYTKIFGN